MELANYKACICEGSAENAIMDILLDYNLLIFNREEMIEEEVIRCREAKKFEEKYKELQPEKYQDTIQHVIQKGNTPAGMHISIMVQEILDFLQIQPGQVGFDAT